MAGGNGVTSALKGVDEIGEQLDFLPTLCDIVATFEDESAQNNAAAQQILMSKISQFRSRLQTAKQAVAQLGALDMSSDEQRARYRIAAEQLRMKLALLRKYAHFDFDAQAAAKSRP